MTERAGRPPIEGLKQEKILMISLSVHHENFFGGVKGFFNAPPRGMDSKLIFKLYNQFAVASDQAGLGTWCLLGWTRDGRDAE